MGFSIIFVHRDSFLRPFLLISQVRGQAVLKASGKARFLGNGYTFRGLNVKKGDFCFLSKAMEIASQRTKEERSSQDHVDEEVRLIIC